MKKVVFITGISSGFGKSTAEYLAQQGHVVYGTSRKEIETDNRINVLKADVTDVDSVKAAIENIEGLSSHADQNELIGWLSKLNTIPSNIFLVHGEEDSLNAMKNKIEEVYDWNVTIPKLNDVFEVLN